MKKITLTDLMTKGLEYAYYVEKIKSSKSKTVIGKAYNELLEEEKEEALKDLKAITEVFIRERFPNAKENLAEEIIDVIIDDFIELYNSKGGSYNE